MTEGLRKDLALMGKEILRISDENFTGNVVISISMRDGGIGQINVKIDKNLKGKS